VTLFAHPLAKQLSVVFIAFIGSFFRVEAAELVVEIHNPDQSAASGVVIYASPNFELKKSSHPQPSVAEMVQVNKQFQPHILVIEKNTEVVFPNQDDIAHHVYSFSPTHPFELELYKDGSNQTERFDKVGTVDLGCNVHDWMLGYIKVVDTPFFALTDETGKATLVDLPKGDYTVNIWHPNIQNKLQGAQTLLTIDEQSYFLHELEATLERPTEDDDFIQDIY
jgi:plastocyanin